MYLMKIWGGMYTIFNEFDTDEHYARVQDFKDIFSKLANINDDILNNLIISLEDLHPKLFNSFSALARTFHRIETEEDIAQCAVSGRRILEQLADYLYPPRKEKYNGRDIGQSQYKNRLWAYVETTVNENSLDASNTKKIGKDIDLLVDLFNTGLHSNFKKEKLENLLEKLIYFIDELIALAPNKVRKPYLAYENNIINFVESLDLLKGND